MEDYIFTDAVLQATHMIQFEKQAKHIKKYDIATPRNSNSALTYNYQLEKQNYTKGQQNRLQQRNKNLSTEQYDNSLRLRSKISKISMQNSQITCQSYRNFQKKSKVILHEHEKINKKERILKKQVQIITVNQFFMKKQINPKSKCSRDNSSFRRSPLNRKSSEISPLYFFDLNMDLIKQKSKNCTIMPQSRPKTVRQANLEVIENQKPLRIRDLIKKEVQEQKRRRKAMCQTANSSMKNRSLITKETKKIEEELRTRQLDNQGRVHCPNHHRQYSRLQINKNTVLPLSKQKLKIESIGIMRKYGVDINKYLYKIHGQ